MRHCGVSGLIGAVQILCNEYLKEKKLCHMYCVSHLMNREKFTSLKHYPLSGKYAFVCL